MSTPTWLPPLNSHNHYSTKVVLQQNHKPQDIPSSPGYSSFSIEIDVSVDFISESSQTSFKGLAMGSKFSVPTDLITSSHFTVAEDIIFNMLSQMSIPFELDRIVLRQRILNTNLPLFLVEDAQSLVENIRIFLCCVAWKTYNFNHNILPVKVQISKVIQISDEEHSAWTSWYSDKKKADPDFEKHYDAAIRRTRTDEELFYEASLKSRAATKSSIDGLDEIQHDEYCSSAKNCRICLEDFLIGSTVIRLPCSHVFHGGCLVKWLQESHVCPLCRFMLPSVE